jgi:hypothetical protein
MGAFQIKNKFLTTIRITSTQWIEAFLLTVQKENIYP